jgi:hypothetical protein
MTTHAASDLDRYDPLWFRKVSYLPMLLPLSGLVLLIGAGAAFPAWFHRLQNWLEVPAPFLVGLAGVIYAGKALRTGNRLYILLAALAAALTCREIHFAGTSRGVYVALGVLALWATLWHRRLHRPLRNWRHTSWLLATFAAYFLSQLIARRAFRFVPGEHAIHRSLEEGAETVAHLTFIVTACLAGHARKPWGRNFSRAGTPCAND